MLCATACSTCGLQVVQFLKDIFTRAAVFEQLQNKCEEWLATLLDICDNKHEVQVLLTPTRHDQPLDERLGLSRPIAFALETGDKVMMSGRAARLLLLGVGLAEERSVLHPVQWTGRVGVLLHPPGCLLPPCHAGADVPDASVRPGALPRALGHHGHHGPHDE